MGSSQRPRPVQGYERMAQALSRRGDMSGEVGLMVGLGAGGGLLLRGYVGELGMVDFCCIALAAFVSEE